MKQFHQGLGAEDNRQWHIALDDTGAERVAVEGEGREGWIILGDCWLEIVEHCSSEYNTAHDHLQRLAVVLDDRRFFAMHITIESGIARDHSLST